MLSEIGLILDTSALIDFKCLDEWSWLKENYSPLYIAQELLDSDNLEADTRQTASVYLQPLAMDTEAMLMSFMGLQAQYPLLSEADRATVAIAQHTPLCCATDDNLMVKACTSSDISYTRTLRLIREMVQTGYRNRGSAIALAEMLISQRNKWISPAVLESWKNSLDSLEN